VIDAKSKIKRTPLHLASIKGFTNIAKILVEKGSNPNHKDFDE